MSVDRLVHSVAWPPAPDPDQLLEYEWLVTNGVGGYASGTVSGVVTRRYHGWLVAALPNPLGRVVMLTHLSEQLRLADGRRIELRGEETEAGHLELHGETFLREFRLEFGLPHWRYDVDGVVLEKSVLLPHGQNTVHVTWSLRSAPGEVLLQLRPSMHFRRHEAAVNAEPLGPYTFTTTGQRYEICGRRHRFPRCAWASGPPIPPSPSGRGISLSSSIESRKAAATKPGETCGARGTSSCECNPESQSRSSPPRRRGRRSRRSHP